ncbi:hypothetical protein LQZ21_10265 [Treponema sp. TIM-1]|uniref:hypothetical protein n=1 Tax=Treponema sp. TIM-1 TaxID=2898417 RepID=UPI0039806912
MKRQMVAFMGLLIGGSLCFWGPDFSFSQSNDTIPAADIPSVGTIPPVLLRPQRGEALRYPRDVLIGELGRGQVAEDAYVFARSLMVALLYKNRNSRLLTSLGSAFWDDFFRTLDQVSPRKYHLGGGKEEVDGSTSFLFRFIGSGQGIAGELYLRKENNNWFLEEIILETIKAIGEGEEPYKYDFSPYERFF